jgi:hypothetical protein
MAADPSWKDKPLASWNQEDVKAVLYNSPWAKTVKAGIARLDSENQRRNTGKTGMEHGVGFDGVDTKGAPVPRYGAELLFHGPNGEFRTNQYLTLRLRWETALPVRMAELKSGGMEPLSLPGEGYNLAVYGVPGSGLKGDPQKLGEPLKKDAVLRREGKKDVKPSDVQVFQREEGLVVVYVFPASAQIGKQDGTIGFSAQIGRIVLSENFDVTQMDFQGKLEI